ELAAVNMGLTIKEAIDRVRGLTRNVETIHNIFVVDNENRLVGILPLDKFILAGPDEMVANIMDKAEICATTNIDQEEVANIFKKYNLVTLPVVDEARRLMGRITIDDVVDVIEEEASEDIMRMAGMDAEELIYESKALKASKLRVPWLLTNLLGGLATGYLLWLFKVTLKDVLALVTFIPVITGMGGNVGIQSSSLMVRGLATGHVDLLNLKKILLKEFKVGVILGTICGSGAGITALLWHKNPMIGIVVGVSMITAMTVAASMGTLIPAFFKLIKVDPAIASGPFVTTANDITGILIYLGTATLFLKFFYNFHA
ncbi:MAG: magnesium transporter, partial [Thermodesulfobacteriota bacterium]|nr:magnesium transporter [Thermodesulfobacteriota bacterium]